jgi:hypothetical protein
MKRDLLDRTGLRRATEGWPHSYIASINNSHLGHNPVTELKGVTLSTSFTDTSIGNLDLWWLSYETTILILISPTLILWDFHFLGSPVPFHGFIRPMLSPCVGVIRPSFPVIVSRTCPLIHLRSHILSVRIAAFYCMHFAQSFRLFALCLFNFTSSR